MLPGISLPLVGLGGDSGLGGHSSWCRQDHASDRCWCSYGDSSPSTKAHVVKSAVGDSCRCEEVAPGSLGFACCGWNSGCSLWARA